MTTRSRAVVAALATVLAIGAGTGARAADLDPVPGGYAMDAPPVPTFLWTGVYAGVDVGYVFDNQSSVRTSDYLTGQDRIGHRVLGELSPKLDEDGITVGGHVGYNYQFGRAVVGVETDLAYTDLYTHANRPDGAAFSAGLDYLGTVRARAGYTFGNVLVYGTGGLAYGGTHARLDGYKGSNSVDGVQLGYAAGGGVEFAVATDSFMNFMHAQGMTIRVEGLHYDLFDQTLFSDYLPTGRNGLTETVKSKFSTAGNLARVGLTYKF